MKPRWSLLEIERNQCRERERESVLMGDLRRVREREKERERVRG